MEVYYMATGAQHWLDLHATHMQGQSHFISGISPNGQPIIQELKGMLEPIRLYRYVFPKESLNLVLNTLTRKGAPLPNGLNTQAWALRKAMNLKPIPDFVESVAMSVSKDHVQIVPIGIKEDEEGIIPTTGVMQEKV